MGDVLTALRIRSVYRQVCTAVRNSSGISELYTFGGSERTTNTHTVFYYYFLSYKPREERIQANRTRVKQQAN